MRLNTKFFDLTTEQITPGCHRTPPAGNPDDRAFADAGTHLGASPAELRESNLPLYGDPSLRGFWNTLAAKPGPVRIINAEFPDGIVMTPEDYREYRRWRKAA